MRRSRAVLVVVVVALGTVGAGALTDGAGGQAARASTLQVRKVVVGTGTQDFTVTVSCGAPNPPLKANGVVANDAFVGSTLTFGPDGTPKTANGQPGWAIVGGQWEINTDALPGDLCTVTETGTGGAASVSYACAWVLLQSPDGVNGVGCPGAASGPSASPATVTFEPGGGDRGTVTITNTFSEVTAVEANANTLTG